MKKLLLAIGVLSGALFSCKKEETPKVKYENEADSLRVDYQKIDTTELKIADLPIHIKELDYLIHPIGKIRVNRSSSGSKYSYSSNGDVSYSISNFSNPEITGAMNNVMFQKLDSTSLKPLTDRKMLIQSITYLDQIAQSSNKKYLLYSVVDMDSNKDGKYDYNDVKSIYISKQDGGAFEKLSPNMQEVLDWKIIAVKSRLYFRTIEDINKNGEFDSTDAINYFLVDLAKDSLSVETYIPVR